MPETKETGWLAVIHWIAVILSIAGSVLVANKLPAAGCGIWIISNALWIAWAALRDDLLTLLVFSVYEVTAVVGMINWMSG